MTELVLYVTSMQSKPVLSFTVQLSKWRCGDYSSYSENILGHGETQLENNHGFMCCLGFACKAAGYTGSMIGKGAPHGLKIRLDGLTHYNSSSSTADVEDTPFSLAAIKINDDTFTTIEEKKKALKTLGERYNIHIDFIP